ncbi:DNA helicase [Shinella sumterensis]|uniref:DEAD/DEAH box helicase n=1 Tax=Shinella sumterensis TaxID=1967501 RepID=UPI00106E141A|nr:DEAD/DEAH box helicase family protein [Shinella sumterensis]MCD1264037.1 DEAD/DEAH box helicase family protein [Shinella sumterensis]TFE99426.1 DNA helicase [Shinella sumterensis]
MAFNPRYYQIEAVDAVFDYWAEEPGHPLVDMATGTGKSGTMAMLDKRLVEGWPDIRILNATHVEELVEGNFMEFVGMCPFAPAGIAAASLNRRDYRAQVVFGQLQTIWDKADLIGHVDVLKIDEVHLVPNDGNTMYRKLIAALFEINPDMKIVGFTATPYRLDSGRLDEGEDRLFDKVVYTYSIAQAIDDGYLTRLTSKPTELQYDMTGVHRLGGDFKKSDLAKATDKEELTRAAVAEIMAYANAENRKTAIIFCNGIDHATHVRDEIRKYGKTCEVLSGKTPKGERRKIIADLKAGRLWGCTNDNVLSTGTNIPGVDLIPDLAPTESANRYVQRAGRGTRVVWPAGFDPETSDAEGRKAAIAMGPKPNCRYMNFAGNIERHGPVDCVTPKKPGKGTGEAPIKVCMQCEEIVAAGARVCPNCGYQFEFEEKPKFTAKPTDVAILATVAEPESRKVRSRKFWFHEKGETPSVKVSYQVGMNHVNEWLCPQHNGFPKSRADRFWLAHGGSRPFPKTVMEWLERQGELRDTAEILVKPRGKWWDVVGHTVAAVANDNVPAPSNNNVPTRRLAVAMADDIPF